WMQELVSNAPVRTNGVRNLLNIRSDGVADIGNLVNETDLHCEKSVGRIFREFRGFAADEDDRRIAKTKWLVNALHHLTGAIVIDTDENAVGVREVLNGGAFAQEFRVGADRDVGVWPQCTDAPF